VVNTQFITVAEYAPPPLADELPPKVQFVTAPEYTPPPESPAQFVHNQEFVSVDEYAPPPEPNAWLPARVQFIKEAP
jgi:hypothetical protein